MTAPARPFEDGFLASPQELARTLARLAAEDAVSLPLLSETAREDLLAASRGLSYRPARPVIGTGDKAVHQDFELCMNPPPGPFHACARTLEHLLQGALAELPDPPLAAAPPLNDVVLQRYRPGALGITPHRDHARYRELVAILTLAGQARFFVCKARSGTDPHEVPIPPGSLLLRRAPGFAGRGDRPFHFLKDVTRQRVCLGLRHDVQADEG